MTRQRANISTHSIETLLRHEARRQPALTIGRQEQLALMLSRGRLPMILRPRGR